MVVENLFPSTNVSLPRGPHATWPLEIREQAIQGLRSRCTFLALSLFGNYQGSQEAGGQLTVALISACVARIMPNDRPDRGPEEERFATAYAAGKRLDPNAPDLAFLADHIAALLANSD